MLSPLGLTMLNPFLSGPIALYRNVPIEPQYYQPRAFVVDDIVLGQNTIVGTEVPTDYVVGQLTRLIIPNGYGCRQLNEVTGYVIGYSVSGVDQLIPVENNNTQTDQTNLYTINLLDLFIPDFPSAFVVTSSLNISILSQSPLFYGIYKDDGSGNILNVSGAFTITSGTIDYTSGVLILNFSFAFATSQVHLSYTISDGASITNIDGIILNIDSSQNVDGFIQAEKSNKPQILAIGDVNTGAINANGCMNVATGIPGAFINISPN